MGRPRRGCRRRQRLMSCRPDPGADRTVAGLVERCHFPPPGSPLTCAVSGGADSLALLALAVAAGCEVTAVHVDHGIRPGSDGEADVVARAARQLGAAFRAERVTVAAGPNLEARARSARFAVLPADVATGHTMDDQAETVLCNLLRGAGLDGLSAMAPGPRHPLLDIRRADARSVCTHLGLSWVEDPTNADPRHLRNRVRHELLPLCAELAGRDPVPILARSATIVRDEAQLLELLAADRVPDPADARRLASAPLPLARRAVRRWLRSAGDLEASCYPPSWAEVERVLAVARLASRGTELAGGRRVDRRRGRLEVRRPGAHPGGEGRSGKVSQVTTTQRAAPAAPPWALPGVGAQVVSSAALARRVAELGSLITADYAGEAPLLVGVLKGAMVFMSDLCRAIDLPVDIDFMAVSSYGSSTRTSGVVRIVKDLDAELAGRHVLVVEDIID
ncbi:MAG TPA: tRNA lysidine(34) synthetase TilS, partial [Acidimicrobiales bacterium]|nr:tRNA lysidine(34) synthetase TilS [Acidimicrobiales bacterium]